MRSISSTFEALSKIEESSKQFCFCFRLVKLIRQSARLHQVVFALYCESNDLKSVVSNELGWLKREKLCWKGSCHAFKEDFLYFCLPSLILISLNAR